VHKILVVDDDPGVRDLCRLVLTNEGYAVLEAEDAATGISLARLEMPDLVLLDWMLPGLDGMDALRALKGSGKTRQIPVVMLTALDGLPQVTMATYSGADGYVTKPFEVNDLLSLIRRFTETPEEAQRAPAQ
jgi:DNA-binding response OmpR family regulator